MNGQNFDDTEEEDDFNPQPADISDDTPPENRKKSSEFGKNNDEDAEGDEEAGAPGGTDIDEEEEEDEEEDDEEEEVHGHRRKRRRERRNQFLDVEAEVDEDEDENDDDEDEINEIKDNFIADTHPDDIADLPAGLEIDDRQHRELDRRREVEASMDAEKQAEILRQRYGAKGRSGRGMGDSTVVPKRLLLPSVDDPSIWAVRCREGKEREAVYFIMKRIEERIGTKDELAITCAFERGGTTSTMKGFIYVEAQRQADILTALDGISNVYPRTKMMLVEIKEMPDLLRVSKTPTLQPGAYVRLRRPAKYAGDLAQIQEVTDTGLEMRIRYVPRLDYGLNEESTPAVDSLGAKRKRAIAGPRPPQRLFSEVEARKRHAKFLHGNPSTKTWNYLGDEYVNGYCEKEVKIQTLVTKDVNPTLEEVTRFASGAEDGTENLDLNALAASLKASTANASYLPGDIIEVYEGEQKGVMGKAVAVQGDIVTMAVAEGVLRGQTIEVPVKGLRKRFKEGDHVKVIGGSRFRDEVGMVVKISDDRVTLLTDQSNTEITVFSKDLREASDSGGSGSLGQFELWDLVQLDPATVACIVKVDRESLVVLDQNSQTRTVMPSQISNKLERRKNAVATDKNGSEVRVDDVVKEAGGENRSGKIIHIHRAYLFLRSTTLNENAGVFVTRTSSVATVAAKGGRITGTAASPLDLNSMNPAMKRNLPSNIREMAPPKFFGRDRSIGQTVTIRKGPYKGLLGIVKETTDSYARVELHTKSKTVNVPKDSLGFRDTLSGKSIDPLSRGRPQTHSRGFEAPDIGSRDVFGGASNGQFDGGRTPIPIGVGRTPAWGTSRTPGAADQGGRTPAWGNSRTPAVFDQGGRTPAWGSKTPAWGSKTPAYQQASNDWSSRTPAAGDHGGRTPAWGSKTPAYQQPSNDWASSQPAASNSWSTNVFDAPTPGTHLAQPVVTNMNAPTPGPYSAPTPAPYSAPTPVAAPTPAPNWGAGGWGAPTPHALDAPTPGAQQGYYAAPTPGAYGAPETPAPTWEE
ncbi:Transcription elongation factor [Podosphaera aphanis]|nr:Transcription elongation factor [Podosphaera aphanis]